MVKEIVVTESLSPEMVETGEKLLHLLDEAKFDVSAALWFYFSDVNAWRLLIASPKVKIEGPRKAYKKVQSVVSKMLETPKVGIQNIAVVDSRDPLIHLLRGALRSGAAISGIRFSKNTINGHFIEDAYIYRLK